MAHRWDCASWFEGDVLIRSNATLLVKLDSRSGRITEFRASDEKGPGTIQMRFEVGAFDHALERIETRTANLASLSDTNAPLSSAAAFLFEEAMSAKYVAPWLRSRMPAETVARLPDLLRQLKLGEVLQPLNQLLAKPTEPGGQADFMIPIDLELGEATRSDLIGLAVGWLLRRSDELFPARSWPWTLLREASLTFQGKGRYTDQALTGIYESNETGPLGYLAVAQALSKLRPALAQKFASRGLERLSAADFRRDYRLFLAGDSVSSQCCQRLAATLRNMDEAQVVALAKLQSPARGEFITDSARRLRAAKEQPILETLTPALDHYWETELKAQVARSLKTQSIDVEEVFKEAVALYQGSSADKAQAAHLFQQAAELGHPGAQFYLGMSYENGAGVLKDVAAAVNWYRQSATNGYAEAGMALGYFYSEGLEVKPDYVEAFVWYSVAAAQGNRIAKLFRNGMMNKLSSEQLAEAEQRVAAIPIRRSPDANAAEPSPSSKDH